MNELPRILDELLPYLARYEAWIYIVLGLIAIFQLRWLFRAWDEWKNSVFLMERDIAQRRFVVPLTILVLLGMLVLGEFLTVSFVYPSYPFVKPVATPTMDILATPTVTLAADVQATAAAPSSQATLDIPLEEGCKPGSIEWIIPKPDESISETIELKGTVNVPNLGFYKYEYSQPGSSTWTTLAAGNVPLVNGTIGFWNTTQLPTGDYLLRLVVADNQNRALPACIVRVRITKP
jgi:hypothetical protein